MALQFTEQVIFDHIKSNRSLREFWEEQITEIRLSTKDDDELVQILSERLGLIYMGNQNALNDLAGLVDPIDLMVVNYPAIAFALLGRDLQLELVSEACKPPAGLEQDHYYLLKDGKKFGPFSFAEISIKWTDEMITSDHKVFLNSKSDWRPISELVAPWTVEGNFYLCSEDSTKSGPFTDLQIWQMWTEGKVTSDYQYWNEGKKEYCPISEVIGELCFNKVAPPKYEIMTEIDEPNANLAIIKIYEYLKPHLDEGWKCGCAFALVDNWKNVYHLHRENETLTLEFDLRQTIPRMAQKEGSFINAEMMNFTMVSPAIAGENAAEIIGRVKEKVEKENNVWKSWILNFLGQIFLLLIFIGGLYLLTHCSSR